jgi:hypothetical protein
VRPLRHTDHRGPFLHQLRCRARHRTNLAPPPPTEPTNPRVFPSPSDTAERVYAVSGPLFADEVPPAAPPPVASEPANEPAYLAPTPHRQQAAGPGLWVAVAAALVVVLLLGGFLLLHGLGGNGDATGSTPPIVPTSNRSPSSTGSPSSPSSSASTTSSSPTVRVTGPPTNVAGFARASAPRHAPSGVDFGGRPVTYVAANLIDGRNDTCWRTPGDATGTELTFRLDQPTRLSRVGLVNGYSKTAYAGGRAFDWYHGNRRVLAVEWLFDDGSSVTQRFGDDRNLQQIRISPVTTAVVRLRLTAVSPPGHGRAARDDTAISEVMLLGRTG